MREKKKVYKLQKLRSSFMFSSVIQNNQIEMYPIYILILWIIPCNILGEVRAAHEVRAT